VLEQLAALAKISVIDAEALRTDIELREIPEHIAEFEGNVKRLAEFLGVERVELHEAEVLLAAQEEELQSQSQALARSKAKGARARNMREADAVERELDVIRRSTKEREEEREKLRTAIAKRRISITKHETEVAELQRLSVEEKRVAEIRIGELQAVREKVMAGRKELAVKLPPDILKRYELIREKRQAGAVAIKTNICAGCNTSLRPNQVIAVLRGETFEQCPRCQRLLYSPEVLKDQLASPEPEDD
jgi:predicted  nucleic acid-binding Zn-ribbon protein